MYNKYNARNHGRYNIPGQFVSASSGEGSWPPAPLQHLQQSGLLEAIKTYEPEETKIDGSLEKNLKIEEQEIKKEEDTSSNNDDSRPPWMKSKLAGVKKISNKERRRRQNETLRRLLTPKNALMVLNEMLPKDQLATNFKVEAITSSNQYVKPHSYRANLTLEGHNYNGFGENKLTARNAAAEQAIRDLIIRKMNKAITSEVSSGGGAGAAEEAEEEPLPMIQLASFALHKLFCEWEVEGHKVPQLKPSSAAQLSDTELALEVEPAPRLAKHTKKPKTLPADASAMHPCMLLTYMRPSLEYRELAARGDRPQNMLYTFALDVDGATYIGKASNKKEARRAAAQAACKALFGVEFDNSVSSRLAQDT